MYVNVCKFTANILMQSKVNFKDNESFCEKELLGGQPKGLLKAY
jgi:hypothetical protein